MIFSVSKKQIRQKILDALNEELALNTRAALMARDEATNEESKSTSKYETHGQEAAYLAETQSKIAAEFQASIAIYTTLPMPDFTASQSADVGALVGLEYRGRIAWYFLGPRNGGLEIKIDGTTITLVTPHSPLGRQIQGARIGDTLKLAGRGTTLAHKVAALA